MKRSVGLVIITRIPDPQNPGPGKFMAVLQRRGTWNTEKMKLESYPGCLQVTCHGKLEGDEGYQEALLRESCEELGKEFTTMLISDISFVELVHETNDEKSVITLGAFVPAEKLRFIRLGPDTGGLDLVSAEDVYDISELTSEFKEKGPEFRYTRIMFADEIQAVKKALEIIAKPMAEAENSPPLA